jgi:hypothetical protein
MMNRAAAIWLILIMAGQAAGLEFPETLKEIHAPADAKIVPAEFEFTKRSDLPVTIAKADPTCSCIAVKIKDGKLRYAPGESGLIRAEFDMGNFSGTVDKVVAVWIKGDPEDKPSVTLTVRVHIPVLVVLEPKTLKWNINDPAEPQTIHIEINHSQPIRVTGLNSSSDKFTQQLKTIRDGKSYEVVVAPVDTKAPSMAVLRIETDCAISKHRIQQAFAVVRKPTPAEAAAAKP